ncbi:T7SS effector LXG polymorphic toxin [Latilactobacillus fragifolii]|uniref:T7SS effector LXG polymorphic toxin n=1 Tax=Latilactobacillus fragifolii TaxID=2814244 RepID=UPI001ABAC1A3|nr:T7SS effector LXG polymorphic toxin [Latilactobacillus fragifolii]
MKVDIAEIRELKSKLERQQVSIQDQINNAKHSLQVVEKEDALSGKVKQAVNIDITNHQIPLLTNYYDILFELTAFLKDQLKAFKETTSENSSSAVIQSEILESYERKFSSCETRFVDFEKQINHVYSSINGIVTISGVSGKSVVEKLNEAKKVLTKTNQKLAAFNRIDLTNNKVKELLDLQKAEINRLNSITSTSYTSQAALKILGDQSFEKAVNKQHLAVKKAEKVALEAYKKRYAKQHPVMLAIEGVLGKENVDQIGKAVNKASGINNKIQNTGDVLTLLGNSVSKFGGMISVAEARMAGLASEGKNAFTMTSKSSVGQAVLKSGRQIINDGKAVGRTLTGVGFGIGVLDDMFNKGKTLGQAIAHSGVATVLGIGVAALAGTFVSAPLALLVVTVGAGLLINTGYEYLYNNNVGGIKDKINDLGQAIDGSSKNLIIMA